MSEMNNGVMDTRISDEQVDNAVHESTAEPKAKRAPKVNPLDARITALEAVVQGMLEAQTALLDTIAELRTVPASTVRANTGGGSTAPRIGNGIFGHSSTSILRWMGKQGWTNKECCAAVSSFGMAVSPATVQTQRQCGRKDIGKLPELTPEQVIDLNARKNFVPVAMVVPVAEVAPPVA